jgi:MFS family permease
VETTASADPDLKQAEEDRGAFSQLLRALRHRNFRLFFGGQFISLVGTFLTQVATIWLVYRLTHNAWWLGVVGFVGQLPLFLLAPVAGVWVDRLNRQKLLVVTQTLAMLQSFALAFLALRGIITTPEIVFLAFIQGVINALDLPARQSFIVEMVAGPEDLANAIALNSTLVQTTRLLGPAAAGLIIHFVGEGMCFLLDGISYIAVIAALLAMHIVAKPPRIPRSVRVELVEGFWYVWHFVPMRVLLALLAILGILMSSSGVGAICASVYLASRKTVVGLGTVIAIAAAVFGAALIAFGCSSWLWLSMIILAVGGWGMVMTFASGNTVLQTLAEEDKRGRVMSFFTMAFIGMTPFGNLAAGWFARHLSGGIDPLWGGATRTLIISGSVCLLGAGAFAYMLPRLRVLVWPIYRAKGILPEVAEGLNDAMQVTVPQR